MKGCSSTMVFTKATRGDGGDGGGDGGDGRGNDGDGGGDRIQTCLRRHQYTRVHISLGITMGSLRIHSLHINTYAYIYPNDEMSRDQQLTNMQPSLATGVSAEAE